MNDTESHDLRRSALKLQEEIKNLDQKDRFLKNAVEILQPLLDYFFSSRLDLLPRELPSQQFFFGMHEDCLPAWHLHDATSLMNAIGEFDAALRCFSKKT